MNYENEFDDGPENTMTCSGCGKTDVESKMEDHKCGTTTLMILVLITFAIFVSCLFYKL